MRYELKYNIDLLGAVEIKSTILLHPASFSKAFPDRIVNNIYFDSADFLFFHENVNGAPDRKKMRLRWYGEDSLLASKSMLEIKNKRNQLGWKDSFSFDTQGINSLDNLSQKINHLNNFEIALLPALQNRYKRSYYVSHDGLFRITVDYNQEFAIPTIDNVYLPTNKRFNNLVELKFEEEDWKHSSDITNYIPYRQTKNSKYVNGISAIFHL